MVMAAGRVKPQLPRLRQRLPSGCLPWKPSAVIKDTRIAIGTSPTALATKRLPSTANSWLRVELLNGGAPVWQHRLDCSLVRHVSVRAWPHPRAELIPKAWRCVLKRAAAEIESLNGAPPAVKDRLMSDAFERAVERVEVESRRHRQRQMGARSPKGFRIHATVFVAVQYPARRHLEPRCGRRGGAHIREFLWALLGWGIGLELPTDAAVRDSLRKIGV